MRFLRRTFCKLLKMIQKSSLHQIWPTSTIIQTYFLLTRHFNRVCDFSKSAGRRKYMYPNPGLQMKHSFWKINLYVICRSGYRSRCKRCTQRWSFLADWKQLMLQKGFSHGFWCTRDKWSFFVSNSVWFWRKGKCFTLLSQSAAFFFQQISYLRPIFVNLSTEKHLYCQLIVAFEKKT